MDPAADAPRVLKFEPEPEPRAAVVAFCKLVSAIRENDRAEADRQRRVLTSFGFRVYYHGAPSAGRVH